MSQPNVIFPNFFIVGAPKCGTTAMHVYLGRHPEVFMAADKENNHFATDLLTETDPFRSDERYFAMFRDAGNRRIVGESSVYYLLSKEAAGNISRFNPEAKILIMLRNPADLLFSFHAQMVYNDDEDILDFEAALEAEAARKSGRLPVRERVRFKERLFYSEVVSLSEQVERYLSEFPRDRVLVILYDDFKTNTAAVFRKTLEFLGVDASFTTDLSVINSRKIIGRGPEKKLSPERIIRGMRKILRKSRDASKSPAMNSRTRKKLERRFRPEIEKLGRLLDCDLSHWCGKN